MEKFKTPKLLITDHYDEQIRHVDIYIEELLEKYNENDLLPKKETNRSKISADDDSDEEYSYSDSDDDTINKLEGFKDPYRSEYNYDQNQLLKFDVIPGTTRVKDYLEVLRSKAIDELKNAQQHNLDNYELNKDLYKYDRKSLTDEKVEEMIQNLFKDKFAFLVKIDESDKSLLKFHTILTDFYLNEKDIEILKRHFQPLKQLNEEKHSDKRSRGILDEKSLFLHFVREYIIGLAQNFEYGTEIISITKSSLFEINQAKIDYMIIENVCLKSTSSIDFSFIKSLTLNAPSPIVGNEQLYEIRDLSGLKQLENLQIEFMLLNPNSFNGLHNLLRLEIISCSSSEDRLCLDSLINLQFLRIFGLYFPVEFKCLENLKTLIIEGIHILENIINVSESVTNLKLLASYEIDVNKADEFFSRVILPKLTHLTIKQAVLTSLKEDWFIEKRFLRELIFNYCSIGSLDFCRFDCLAHLEKLDLLWNKIEKLDDGVFSKFKHLKSLNLSNNPILELGSNKFLGLENLETLFLDKINLRNEFNRIEKDVFNGLTNIKRLSLNENNLEYIDPETFNHKPKLTELSLDFNNLESIDPKIFSYTPNLVELKICSNNMKIEENIFANLKHLKRIVLGENDVEFINKDLFEMLKKSEIKLVIEDF